MINRLWEKLFRRNDLQTEAELHSTGATVRHKSPFADLEVFRNDDELNKEFVDKWVVPYYMTIPLSSDSTEIDFLAKSACDIDLLTTKQLLGYFDWRPKITGAYFSAINDNTDFEDLIGVHLLKSEVCYAGAGYSLALASFATDKSKDYLIRYLEYYLDKKDLYFDQAEAFCALEYIDPQSARRLDSKWAEFVADKPYWNLEKTRTYFLDRMNAIKIIRECKDKNYCR